MFRLVCRKIGLFPAILHRKMFPASLQRVTLILLLTTFLFIFGWVTLFSVLCLEEQPSPFFVLKLRSLPFILPKTCFGFLATTVEAASLSSQKTTIRLFVAKYAAATRICFGLSATKLGFFEAYITKNNVFAFCWETRWNQLYSTNTIFWFVRRKIVLLTALLHREKVFF